MWCCYAQFPFSSPIMASCVTVNRARRQQSKLIEWLKQGRPFIIYYINLRDTPNQQCYTKHTLVLQWHTHIGKNQNISLQSEKRWKLFKYNTAYEEKQCWWSHRKQLITTKRCATAYCLERQMEDILPYLRRHWVMRRQWVMSTSNLH